MRKSKKCSICRSIPKRVGEFIKAGELDSDPMPEAVGKLQVVGEPSFAAGTSNTCLKVCPNCGTYYRLEYKYDYLPYGSEEEFILTRVSDREGKAEEKRIIGAIKKAREEFQDRIGNLVWVLENNPKQEELEWAASQLRDARSMGLDISDGVELMVKALRKHQHLEDPSCEGYSLVHIMSEMARENPAVAESVLATVSGTTGTGELDLLVFLMKAHLADHALGRPHDRSGLLRAIAFYSEQDDPSRIRDACRIWPLFVDALLGHVHEETADCPGEGLAELVRRIIDEDSNLKEEILTRLRQADALPPEATELASELSS